MKTFPNFDNSSAGERAIGNNRESVAVPWDPIWRGAGQESILSLFKSILPLWPYFPNEFGVAHNLTTSTISESHTVNNLTISARLSKYPTMIRAQTTTCWCRWAPTVWWSTMSTTLWAWSSSFFRWYQIHIVWWFASKIILFNCLHRRSYYSIVCNKDHIV